MKKPVLSPQDKTRILIACVELPIVHRPPRQPEFLREIIVTVLDFHMRSEVVTKAMIYFRDHVRTQHDIQTHDKLMEVMARFPDTKTGNTQASQFLWNNNHWQRAQLLRGLLAYFKSIGVTDLPTLLGWAKQAQFEKDFQGKVHGLGMAVFQWLVMRLGVDGVKPDVWVFKFAERILGRRLSDKVTVDLFNELAPLVGTSIAKIDATIWAFERSDMTKRDAPALRIVFWQQLKKQLNERIDADRVLKAGNWQFQLDGPERLRYEHAGFRMLGRLRFTGEAHRITTRVELKQSTWHELFELRLALQRDKPLKEEVFADLTRRLTQTGWVMGNAGQFEASRALDIQLMLAPDMSIEALIARVDDVAGKTLLAIGSVTQAKADEPEPGPA